MSTKYPEIMSALAEPFTSEVKTLDKGKFKSKYITARAVMNRLDSVVGPENWFDEYTPLQNGILCKLTIRFPDGEEICKSDAGGHAGMSDEGDDEKSGFSDAFKRAAVKWGVGRHLYGEGYPRYSFAKPATNGKPNPNGPQTTKELVSLLKAIDPDGTAGPIEFLKSWGVEYGYDPLISKRTDEQSRAGFAALVKHQEAAGKEPA